MMVKEEFEMPASADNLVKKKSDSQPDNKDRTLFCINIDAKCSEDILYELFLQVDLNFIICLHKIGLNI